MSIRRNSACLLSFDSASRSLLRQVWPEEWANMRKRCTRAPQSYSPIWTCHWQTTDSRMLRSEPMSDHSCSVHSRSLSALDQRHAWSGRIWSRTLCKIRLRLYKYSHVSRPERNGKSMVWRKSLITDTIELRWIDIEVLVQGWQVVGYVILIRICAMENRRSVSNANDSY